MGRIWRDGGKIEDPLVSPSNEDIDSVDVVGKQ